MGQAKLNNCQIYTTAQKLELVLSGREKQRALAYSRSHALFVGCFNAGAGRIYDIYDIVFLDLHRYAQLDKKTQQSRFLQLPLDALQALTTRHIE